MVFSLFQTHRASFRGVNFLVNSVETEEGRKTVTHEYPNQKARFVEDLGQNLRKFKVNGTLSGPLYKAEKRRLEDALNKKGIGIFRHPFYGNVNVVVTRFKLREDLSSVGEATLEIEFQEANINTFPREAKNNQSKINDLIDNLSGKIDDFIENNFITNFADNISDAGEILGEFLGLIEQAAAIIVAASEDLNQFYSELSAFEVEIFSLIQSPSSLASSMSLLIEYFDNLGSTADDRIKINEKLFGFGSSQSTFPLDTLKSQEKQKNRDILNSSINGKSLINDYNASVIKTYQNDEELSNQSKNLEDNYQYFIENNIFNEEMIADLEEIRSEVNDYFSDLNLKIDKIISVDTKEIPLTVLTYKYYGDINRRDEILELNDIYDPSLVSGEIKILEEQQ